MSSSQIQTTPPVGDKREGLPLPLGVSWVEDEQAFNFAVYAEHAESVKLFSIPLPTWRTRC